MKTALAVLTIFSLSASVATAQTIKTDGSISGQVTRYMIDAPNNYYVGTTEGIFRSSDKGVTWVALNLRATNVRSIVMAGRIIYAGTDGGGAFASVDDGQNWKPVNNGLSNRSVLSLATSDSGVFAGTRDGGIFVTDNRGESWRRVSDGIPPDANVWSISPVGSTLYAGTEKGVFSSHTDAVKWTKVSERGQ